MPTALHLPGGDGQRTGAGHVRTDHLPRRSRAHPCHTLPRGVCPQLLSSYGAPPRPSPLPTLPWRAPPRPPAPDYRMPIHLGCPSPLRGPSSWAVPRSLFHPGRSPHHHFSNSPDCSPRLHISRNYSLMRCSSGRCLSVCVSQVINTFMSTRIAEYAPQVYHASFSDLLLHPTLQLHLSPTSTATHTNPAAWPPALTAGYWPFPWLRNCIGV